MDCTLSTRSPARDAQKVSKMERLRGEVASLSSGVGIKCIPVGYSEILAIESCGHDQTGECLLLDLGRRYWRCYCKTYKPMVFIVQLIRRVESIAPQWCHLSVIFTCNFTFKLAKDGQTVAGCYVTTKRNYTL